MVWPCKLISLSDGPGIRILINSSRGVTCNGGENKCSMACVNSCGSCCCDGNMVNALQHDVASANAVSTMKRTWSIIV